MFLTGLVLGIISGALLYAILYYLRDNDIPFRGRVGVILGIVLVNEFMRLFVLFCL